MKTKVPVRKGSERFGKVSERCLGKPKGFQKVSMVNLWKGYAQKLRGIILLQFELRTSRFHYWKSDVSLVKTIDYANSSA